MGMISYVKKYWPVATLAIWFAFGVWLGVWHSAHAQTGAFAGGQKFVVISGASTNAQLIGIPGPHQLLELSIDNTAATIQEVKLYDTAVSPTCSVAPIGLYVVAGATAPATGMSRAIIEQVGASFQNGIGVCIVTAAAPPTLADTGNALAGVVVNFTIK